MSKMGNKILKKEGYTFDDVFTNSAEYQSCQNDVQLAKNIRLIISFNEWGMIFVTAHHAIAIARQGGLGVIHKNMSIA